MIDILCTLIVAGFALMVTACAISTTFITAKIIWKEITE